MAADDDDRPPPERSARVRVGRNCSISGVRRPQPVDPRFSDLYGTADERQCEANYKFLRELQDAEETRRRHRMRCLKCLIRRAELEAACVDLEEYDLSETERDVFGEDNLDELMAMRLRPLCDLQVELRQLQRESQLYTTRSKGRQVQSRRDTLRKDIIKREVTAVKEGKKQRPFIPKRAQLKRQIIADTYERLEQKGGKVAVEKYMERKNKRRF